MKTKYKVQIEISSISEGDEETKVWTRAQQSLSNAFCGFYHQGYPVVHPLANDEFCINGEITLNNETPEQGHQRILGWFSIDKKVITSWVKVDRDQFDYVFG